MSQLSALTSMCYFLISRALKFEEPTALELEVASKLRDDAALRDIHIDFDELELQERIGLGAFGVCLCRCVVHSFVVWPVWKRQVR